MYCWPNDFLNGLMYFEIQMIFFFKLSNDVMKIILFNKFVFKTKNYYFGNRCRGFGIFVFFLVF